MGDRTLLERLDVDVRDSGDRRQFRHKPLGLADVVARRHLATTRADDAHDSRKRRERTSSRAGGCDAQNARNQRRGTPNTGPRGMQDLRWDWPRPASHICDRTGLASSPTSASGIGLAPPPTSAPGLGPRIVRAQLRREGCDCLRIASVRRGRPTLMNFAMSIGSVGCDLQRAKMHATRIDATCNALKCNMQRAKMHATGKDATSKDATGKDATGKDATAKDATAKDATAKDATGTQLADRVRRGAACPRRRAHTERDPAPPRHTMPSDPAPPWDTMPQTVRPYPRAPPSAGARSAIDRLRRFRPRGRTEARP